MELEEQWTVIEDFPDYGVSNHGRVMNLKMGREISGHINGYGQRRVSLRKDGRTYVRSVGQLVAQAFLTGWKPDIKVYHHKDKDDDHLLNIRFGNGRGVGVIRKKLEDKKERRIRVIETGMVFRNVETLSKFINGDLSTIYKVLRGERISCRGYTFEYVYV